MPPFTATVKTDRSSEYIKNALALYIPYEPLWRRAQEELNDE